MEITNEQAALVVSTILIMFILMAIAKKLKSKCYPKAPQPFPLVDIPDRPKPQGADFLHGWDFTNVTNVADMFKVKSPEQQAIDELKHLGMLRQSSKMAHLPAFDFNNYIKKEVEG